MSVYGDMVIHEVHQADRWLDIITQGAFISCDSVRQVSDARGRSVTFRNRINPVTNQIADVYTDSFEVGYLWLHQLGDYRWLLRSRTQHEVVVAAGPYELTVWGDSLIRLRNTSNSPISFESRMASSEYVRQTQDKSNVMRASPQGGITNLREPGAAPNAAVMPNGSVQVLSSSQSAYWHLFPARQFKYGSLYDKQTHPHIAFISRWEDLGDSIDQVKKTLNSLYRLGFGNVVPFESCYNGYDGKQATTSYDAEREWMSYRWRDADNVVQPYLDMIRAAGMKVCMYLKGREFWADRYPAHIETESRVRDNIIAYIQEWRDRYSIGGIYTDNNNFGDWLTSRHVLQKVHELFGSDATVILHNSYDIVFGDTGGNCTAVNTWGTHSLIGEAWEVDSLTDPGWLYRTGVGIDQCIMGYKPHVKGLSYVSPEDQLAVHNVLHGSARSVWLYPSNHDKKNELRAMWGRYYYMPWISNSAQFRHGSLDMTQKWQIGSQVNGKNCGANFERNPQCNCFI